MPQNYWSATYDIKKRLGGKNPICPVCQNEMFPEDDHGRFKCFDCLGKPSTNMADFPRLTFSGGKLGTLQPGDTEKD